MTAPIAEIVIQDTSYVAYYHGTIISKGKSLVKVSKALAQHIKGQQ